MRKLTVFVEASEYEADDLMDALYAFFESQGVEISHITNEGMDDERED